MYIIKQSWSQMWPSGQRCGPLFFISGLVRLGLVVRRKSLLPGEYICGLGVASTLVTRCLPISSVLPGFLGICTVTAGDKS
jgi:hypothetical protein